MTYLRFSPKVCVLYSIEVPVSKSESVPRFHYYLEGASVCLLAHALGHHPEKPAVLYQSLSGWFHQQASICPDVLISILRHSEPFP